MRDGRKSRAAAAARAVDDLPSQLICTEGPGHSIGLAVQGVNSGQGFAFVSHTGDVYPSGFLPASAGNLREHRLKSMYQDSELFRQLRRPHEFKGVCGICEFNKICGGSRSRRCNGDYLKRSCAPTVSAKSSRTKGGIPRDDRRAAPRLLFRH
jgi:radical SAM protein with 4Fe4S-binding SPASM domain